MGNFEEKLKQAESEINVICEDKTISNYVTKYTPDKYKKTLHNVNSFIVLCIAVGIIFTAYHIFNLVACGKFDIYVDGVLKINYFGFGLYVASTWGLCGLPIIFLSIVKKKIKTTKKIYESQNKK